MEHIYTASKVNDVVMNIEALNDLRARFDRGEISPEAFARLVGALAPKKTRAMAKPTSPLHVKESAVRIDGVLVSASTSKSQRSAAEHVIRQIELALKKGKSIKSGRYGDTQYQLSKNGQLAVLKPGESEPIRIQLAAAADALPLLLPAQEVA